ncbi:MAG: hypothetical protein P4L45_11655 [Ignavibacteriaceae bacterium]|nr:hypothetical protein [Ignavibacteriaceae bacterium]
MGQQQLLLIVLGAIIVGLAITVGISLFTSNAQSANRDAVINDLNNLGSLARKYYISTISLGGGNQSFTGWTIPANLATNGNGSFTSTASDQQVVIIATGIQTGKDGTTQVKVTNYVTSLRDSIVINN